MNLLFLSLLKAISLHSPSGARLIKYFQYYKLFTIFRLCQIYSHFDITLFHFIKLSTLLFIQISKYILGFIGIAPLEQITFFSLFLHTGGMSHVKILCWDFWTLNKYYYLL